MSKGETAMGDKYAGILERLEGAVDGGRELDVLVLEAVDPQQFSETYWNTRSSLSHDLPKEQKDITARQRMRPPPYTTSLDVALQLVPEGATWELTSEPSACINLLDGRFLIKEDTEVYGHAATPALSMCIAALRARQAIEDREGE
jgi:hypothetical protein